MYLIPVHAYLALEGFDGHLNDVLSAVSSSALSLRSILL